MGTRFPQKLLYTMAVILAVLTTLFLILTVVLKISDLLVSSSSSQTKDKSRIEATTVGKAEGEYDCTGGSALYDADGLTGTLAYVCNGDLYRMDHLADGRRELFVINADGTGKQRLTSAQASAEDLNRIQNVLWLP